MITYLFLVAVLNVGLGFVAAWHLGRRYRWAVSMAGRSAASVTVAAESPQGEAMPAATVDNTIAESVSPPAETDPAAAPAPAEIADPAESAAEKESPPGEAWMDALMEAPPAEIALDADETPPQESLPESLTDRLDLAIRNYQEELTSIEGELRLCLDEPQVQPIRACLDSLSEANQKYLGAQQEVKAGLHTLDAGDFPEAAVEAQALAAIEQQVEATQELVESFNYDGDLRAGCHDLLDGTGRLQEQTRELRGAIELGREKPAADLPAEPAAVDPPAEKAGNVLSRDALTGLLTWEGLSAVLHARWQHDRQRPLSLAVVNVDGFAELKERLGERCCDRILQSIAQLLTVECREDCRVARCDDAFALMLSGRKLPDATSLVERLRQSLEATRFVYLESEVRLTISGGIAQAMAEDTPESLLQRTTAAVSEAKRYGRNRCFECDGKLPTPVAPAQLALQEKHVLL